MTLSRCPVDVNERMELYCLDRLPYEEARLLEAHMALCPACFYEALDTDHFLESLLTVLRQFDESDAHDSMLAS